MDNTALETFRRLASNFAAYILWTAGLPEDPYETEDAESCSPAPAAFVLAQVARWSGLQPPLGKAFQLMSRCAEILSARRHAPLCRVWIRFYALLTYLDLAPQAAGSGRDQWIEALRSDKDDRRPPVSAGCAALQIGTQLLLHHLGLSDIDLKQVKEDLALIAGQQLESGFINDNLREDEMPMARHLLILAHLAAAIPVVRQSQDPAIQELITDMDGLFTRGFAWLLRFLTPDGSLAMVGKDAHQISTLGALLTVFAYAGMPPDSDPVLDALGWWLPFRREEGTFPVVPNHFPPGLRVGYEPEARFAACNSLAFAGMCLAARLWEGSREGGGVSLPAGPQGPEGRRIEAIIREDGLWVDEASGYARLRSGDHFLAITLRKHAKNGTPAWQLFGVVLGGGKCSPLPEPRFRGEAPFESVWEGFAVQDQDRWRVPDWKVSSSVQRQNEGLELTVETADFAARKWLGFIGDRLVVEYQLTARRNLGACRGVWPILLSDGRNDAELKFARNVLSRSFKGESFSIACPEGFDWRLGLPRMFLSPSGAAALAFLTPAPFLPAGATARWSVVVEREYL